MILGIGNIEPRRLTTSDATAPTAMTNRASAKPRCTKTSTRADPDSRSKYGTVNVMTTLTDT